MNTQENSGKYLWAEMAAILSIAVIPDFFRAITTVWHPELLNIEYPSSYLPLYLIARSVTVCIPVLFIIHITEGRGISGYIQKFKAPKDIFSGLLIYVASFIGLYVAGVVLYLTCHLLGTELTQPELPFKMPSGAISITLLTVGLILNSFAEELVMRAYFIEKLEKTLKSTTYAIIFSALIFAVYHVYQGVYGTINVFILGIFYGYAYHKTRRLWPITIAHTIQNLLIFAQMPK